MLNGSSLKKWRDYECDLVCRPVGRSAVPKDGGLKDGFTGKIEEDKMCALKAKLRAEGYKADGITTYGDIEHQVQLLVKSLAADLVALGTHGRRGVERLVSGSDAEALIYNCEAPILTMDPACASAPAGVWLLDRILCVASPGTCSAKAAAYGNPRTPFPCLFLKDWWE